MESTEIIDYPAAHSMDTYWFAVDADGNVAMFDTGEGGAVPEDAFRSCDGLEFFLGEIAKESADNIIEVGSQNDVLINELKMSGLIENLRESVFDGIAYDLILLLKSAEVITELGVESIERNYLVKFNGERTIVYISQMPLTILQKLITDRKVIAGKSIYLNFDYPLAALCGFFEYEHERHTLVPYARKHIPQYPLKLADLPERLQTQIIEAGIDRVKFTQSVLVQPLEHVSCIAWGSTDYWIDTQGIAHYPENPDYTWDAIEKVWLDEDGNKCYQAW